MLKKILSATLMLATLTTMQAADWPAWRGPNGNGVAPGSDFPTSWSADTNIRWKYDLPGEGASTPIVVSDQVVVTAADGQQNAVICLSRKGTKLWETKIGKERQGKHKKATGSNSSPVTDGKNVFAYFKSGDLACVSLADGSLQWHVNLQEKYGEDTLWWDLGTSPVLTQKSVVVACMQHDNSYVVALDKETGAESWFEPRNLGAPSEAQHSYSTPIVVEQDGKEIIYVLGGDFVTAQDAANGKELWRVGGLNPTKHQYFRSISSPVIEGNILLAPYARGGTLTAIKLGGSGDVTKSHVLWTNQGTSADVPTPTAKQGKAYVCGDKGTVYCLDIANGKEIWKASLPKHRTAYSSSPILADGHLYLTREDSTTFVLDATNGDLLQTNKLDGMTVATPVLIDDIVLVRTKERLYCIGE